MQQRQSQANRSFPNNPASLKTPAKLAPRLLSDADLKAVAGGLGPKGGWEQATSVEGPKGGW